MEVAVKRWRFLVAMLGVILGGVVYAEYPVVPLAPPTALDAPRSLMILPTIPRPAIGMPSPEANLANRQTSVPSRHALERPHALSKQYTETGVYLSAAEKHGLSYKYSCEFDAAWIILRSYGLSVSVNELIEQFPRDQTVEPYLVEQRGGFKIIGGDILRMYSGDFRHNYLSRTSGVALASLFLQYGFGVKPVHTQTDIVSALNEGAPVWIKATVDFADGRPALWVTPSGDTIPTVLGNDHAVVVVGYTDKVVIIKDPLGPTTSNLDRPYSYEIPWERFLRVWSSQQNDGLAIFPPKMAR
jgi:hypothetical protein